jgi:hypothetical protein
MTAAQPRPAIVNVYRDDAGRELIQMTRNEILRLFTGLLHRSRPARDQLRWSAGRRRHQATARTSHYSAARPSPSPDHVVTLEY